eukprot:CAMPEP_0169291056 /NCGR_PEP_ID=MMETSP1016-20121227/62032_1 /TAXON_ID=342587 /ORGANISM="Karlodinium micrum, Strain CCMP2283" /LENGTH=40 /DNA_ID= /DNA_START= /DNA_END= /DNA_ORIENTATION=
MTTHEDWPTSKLQVDIWTVECHHFRDLYLGYVRLRDWQLG